MRIILFTLFLFFLQLETVVGQSLDKAIFKECITSGSPIICTEEKFKNDISNLITYDISDDIKQQLDKNYFSVSIIFVTNHTGALIPEYTEVKCDFPKFKTTIENYISTLPALHPKDETDDKGRTLHTLYYTFMFDHVVNKYYPASEERLVAEGISPEYYKIDAPALYPGCKCKKRSAIKKASNCSSKKLLQYISKNFNTPPSGGNPRKVKILSTIIIEEDGTITIQSIIGPEEDLNKEMERVIKTIPSFKPAQLKGFPKRTAYNFPTTITFNQ